MRDSARQQDRHAIYLKEANLLKMQTGQELDTNRATSGKSPFLIGLSSSRILRHQSAQGPKSKRITAITIGAAAGRTHLAAFLRGLNMLLYSAASRFWYVAHFCFSALYSVRTSLHSTRALQYTGDCLPARREEKPDLKRLNQGRQHRPWSTIG